MNKATVGAIGLSGLLLFGTPLTVVLGHDGQEHQGQQSEYGAWEDSKRYDSQYENDLQEEEEYSDDTYRSSSRRYPPSEDWESPTPRERSERRW